MDIRKTDLARQMTSAVEKRIVIFSHWCFSLFFVCLSVCLYVCLNICSFRSFVDCQIRYFCCNPLCTPKTECALLLPLLSSSPSPLPVAALHPITQLKEQKRESRLRYNPKDWAPVFERNRQRQQTRGRSLDPNHKFLF